MARLGMFIAHKRSVGKWWLQSSLICELDQKFRLPNYPALSLHSIHFINGLHMQFSAVVLIERIMVDASPACHILSSCVLFLFTVLSFAEAIFAMRAVRGSQKKLADCLSPVMLIQCRARRWPAATQLRRIKVGTHLLLPMTPLSDLQSQ